MATDVTVEVLREIRDEIRSMNGRLGQTNERLDHTNEQLDQNNLRLGRVEQGLLDLGQFMRQFALDQSRNERFHVHHVDVLERDVEDLKGRVSRLEGRSSE